MLVSQKWLGEYVRLNQPIDAVTERLTMTGLNHEGSESVGGDLAINLEVTSNRPDCLGHIGVAREIAAACEMPLQVADPRPATSGESVDQAIEVAIQCPQLCYRFTARLIRGVKIGPSPAWLVDRLATIGVNAVNNIVDISNYVMFECGQPLHIFDYDKLQGKKIIVREPLPNETLLAIDHKTYSLQPGMCVIADANRAVGLGGVMGGADTEVSDGTVNLLVEAAHFSPMSIRQTARKLNLHSAASYRFERTIDGHQIDWASRRCCELILQLAGGKLAEGMIDVGDAPIAAPAIRFRTARVAAVLGIEIPAKRCQDILQRLGFVVDSSTEPWTVTTPSWRRDVTREVDLIEEVGRIHGYHNVPDDRPVPMAASHRSPQDRVLNRIRSFLTAAGLDEAMTASLVPDVWSNSFSPWTDAPPLVSEQPMLGVLEKSSQNIGAVNQLRRSLIPSLLESFRINEYRSNEDIHLFEIASVYLAKPSGLPEEPTKIGIVSRYGFYEIKGLLEGLVGSLNADQDIKLEPFEHELLDPNLAGQLLIDGQVAGFIGQVSESCKRLFGFRQSATVAEMDLAQLHKVAVIIPKHQDLSPFPAIHRDFNFVVDEQLRWSRLETAIRSAGGELLHALQFKEVFRDESKDGPGKKRLLVAVVLQSTAHTLTGNEADQICKNIIDRCQSELNATLLA